MSSPLRCGITGTGAFAQQHAKAMATLPLLQLSGVCDSSAERARSFARAWRCNAHETLDALLRSSIDVLVIATPNNTHASLVHLSLEHPNAPRLVIVEKPLCTNAEELQELDACVRTKGHCLVVDLPRRFNAGFERARDFLEAGELGDMRSVHWRYYAGWLHTGTHAVDTLRMLLGELRCETAKRGPVDRFPDDPLLSATLVSDRFPATSIRLEGIPEHPYGLFEAEIFLQQGRMRLVGDRMWIDRLRDNGRFPPVLWPAEEWRMESTGESLQHLYAMAAAFLQEGNSGIMRRTGFTQQRKTMELLFAAQSKAGL